MRAEAVGCGWEHPAGCRWEHPEAQGPQATGAVAAGRGGLGTSGSLAAGAWWVIVPGLEVQALTL